MLPFEHLVHRQISRNGILFFSHHTWFFMSFSLVQNNWLVAISLSSGSLLCTCLNHDDVIFTFVSYELILIWVAWKCFFADAAYCDGQESIYRGIQRFMGGKGRQRTIFHSLVKTCFVLHLIRFFFISGLLRLHCYRLLWGRRHVRISWRLKSFQIVFLQTFSP